MLKAIYHFFFGRQFEFYSPYSKNYILLRIERHTIEGNLEIKGVILGLSYRVLPSNHPDYCDFEFRDSVSKYLYLIVKGSIEVDNDGVFIKGTIQLSKLVRFGASLAVLGFILNRLIFEPSIISTIFATSCIMICFLSNIYWQNETYNDILNILGKSKKKH